MKIEEQVLSIEQMKHLQELGVDTSDASMCWLKYTRTDGAVRYLIKVNDISSHVMPTMEAFPTYSIGDLIEKLPKYYYAKENPIEMCAINGSGAFVVYYDNIANTYIMKGDTIKDALYKLLCWIAENHKELLEVKK